MENTLKTLVRQNERILQALAQIETRLHALQHQLQDPQVAPLPGLSSLGLTVEDRSNVVDMHERQVHHPLHPQHVPSALHPANHPQGTDRWMKEMAAIAQVVDSIREVAGPAPTGRRFASGN